MSANSASDVFALTARSEPLVNALDKLAAVSGVPVQELVEKCDRHLEGKGAFEESLRQFLIGVFGKTIPEEDKESALRAARTFLISLEILKSEGKKVEIDGIMSVDVLTMGLILQSALAGVTKPASAPVAVAPSNFSELNTIVPQLILAALKSSPMPWRAISASHATQGMHVAPLAKFQTHTAPDASRFMMVQLFQSFVGMNTRAVAKQITDRTNELAGVDNCSPLADALAVSGKLHLLNSGGRFHTGSIVTICGNTGTAACMLKGAANYGACCGKHLPMGLALVPTGPFCMSHGISAGPASSIALHALLTLSFVHIMSIVFADANDEGTVELPLNIEQPPQGYALSGNTEALDELNRKFDGMNDDVQTASKKIRDALGELFKGDNLTFGGLATHIVPNGISALKTSKIPQKNLTQFVQQCIAGRSWYLRMLNLINHGDRAFVESNFSRENIVRQVVASSTVLAMLLNFNAVDAETVALVGRIFPDVQVPSPYSAADNLNKFLNAEQFIAGLSEESHVIPAPTNDGPVKLEASLSVTMIKPTTTGKIPEGNVIVFVHGPVLHGTGFIAAPKAPKAIGESLGNSDFFQTPGEEFASIRNHIKDIQEKKTATKPAPKARGKSSATSVTGPRVANSVVIEMLEGYDDLLEDGFTQTSTHAPPANALRNSLGAAAAVVIDDASFTNMDFDIDLPETSA